MPHKIDVLRRHCDAVGRDFADIRLTAGFFDDPFADVDEYLRTLDRFAALDGQGALLLETADGGRRITAGDLYFAARG